LENRACHAHVGGLGVGVGVGGIGVGDAVGTGVAVGGNVGVGVGVDVGVGVGVAVAVGSGVAVGVIVGSGVTVGVGVGAGVIENTNGELPVPYKLMAYRVAVIDAVHGPTGVPEIIPFDALIVSPVGRPEELKLVG
jgi:hypothetical protein